MHRHLPRGARRSLLLALAVLPVLAVAVSCLSGLPGSRGGGGGVAFTPAGQVGQGLELGIALTAPVTENNATGAIIPGAPGEPDRAFVFYAFVTAAAADDGDGNGVPIARNAPAPMDTNGTSDVFLAAVESTNVNAGSGFQPSAFSQALVNVFRHPRCVNCHSFHNSGMGAHTGGGSPGHNNNCVDCHTLGVAGAVWQAPIGAQFDFRGKSIAELCAQAQTFPMDAASIEEHLKTDDKILWALERGAIPANGPGGGVPLPTVGLTRAQWEAQIDAWVAGGLACDASSSLRDVILVSRRSAVDQSGNAASLAPSLTYVPNPAFNPAAPGQTNPAGLVHVAYATDATDILVLPNNRIIYRATFRVDVGEDPWGVADPAGINLEFVAGTITSVPSTVTNADMNSPALSDDGNLVAFESAATNLITGFTGPPVSNIYLRNFASGTTTLISRSTAVGGTRGGDQPSFRPVIRSNASHAVVAYESDATDLVASDTNGQFDIFYGRVALATSTFLAQARASVRTGGGEATVGDSRHAALYSADPSGDEVLVAFESDSHDLVARGGLPPTNVYLFDSRTGGTTSILSDARTAGGGLAAANGSSRRPSFSPGGDLVVFETSASNLDQVRPQDLNGVPDVVVVDVERFLVLDELRIRRLSIASDGRDGNGASTAPRIGILRHATTDSAEDVYVTYDTAATNLGAADSSDALILFLEDFASGSGTPGNVPPVCNPGPAKRGTRPEHAILFDASLSFDPDAGDSIVSYEWDFGDGQIADGVMVSHTYGVTGTFDVVLVVTDAVGDTSFCEVEVLVVDAPTFTDAYSVLAAKCTNCHAPGNGFDMGTRASAYDTLVDDVALCNANEILVIPFDAAASFLINKVQSAFPVRCGGAMPPAPAVPLTAGQVQTLRDWIDAGALDN